MQPKLVVLLVGGGSILLLVVLVFLLFALPTPYQANQTNHVSMQPTSSTTPVKATSTLAASASTSLSRADIIYNWYTPLTPLTLGSASLQASIADTEADREEGLSGTPSLPEGVVKLFIFDTAAPWAFWMKDMSYPIDIIWLDATKTVIHIEHDLTPDSYPATYAPPSPALYVIETPASYATSAHITLGTKARW